MMNRLFKSISPKEIEGNLFSMLDDEWMLVTAGIRGDYNMMTASWGGFGVLWKQTVAYVFIRPQRYTYLFSEKYKQMSLSFFSSEYRQALELCGSKSGREVDKTAATGLTPMELPGGGMAFEQAKLILETEKMYAGNIMPEHFISNEIQKMYPSNDYHRLYVCKITGVYLHQ